MKKPSKNIDEFDESDESDETDETLRPFSMPYWFWSLRCCMAEEFNPGYPAGANCPYVHGAALKLADAATTTEATTTTTESTTTTTLASGGRRGFR